MPAHLHIEGIPGLNGDYPLEVSRFNNRELHTIKRIAGVRPAELEEAFDADDNDLVVAFAIIALTRAGMKVNEEAIWQAEVGKITLVATADEEEEDESPPAQAPSTETSGGASRNESSGESLSNGSDPLESRRSPTGTPR